MKLLKILLAFFVLSISNFSFAQSSSQDTALSYHKNAFKAFLKNDFKNCFDLYEKLFATPFDGFKNNYNFYRASVSACQINKPDKALFYFNEMASNYLDYGNYLYFANDTLAKCLRETVEWKNAMVYMKPKFDSVIEGRRVYYAGITDKTKRLNNSQLNDTTFLSKLFAENDFDRIYQKLKSYKNYTKPPVLNHWTLYEIKLNDTLTVPFLVYIPKNYKPSVRTPLYLFLQGAVSNRPEFDIEDIVPVSELSVTQNPIKENAFIIYPYSRKDINWLYHPLAFKAISNEIAFIKSLYNIDDNKVYMTGHSDGGRGVLYFAVNKRTDFASFLSLNSFPKSYITNTSLRNLKSDETLYGISGKTDNLFSFNKVDSIYNYGKSIGGNWVNYALEGGHGLPYNNGNLINFIYDTIIQKNRNPFPKSVEWETDNINNGRYKWIEITKLDTTLKKESWVQTYNPTVTDNTNILNFNKNKTGVIKASIKGNEVTITASCISEFSFYVYPELVDITKPIRFIVNNKTFFTVIPKADKNDLAYEFVKSKDRTMLPIEKITLGFGD